MADCKEKIPITLKEAIIDNNNDEVWEIFVPCGKCARCLERRKAEWGFRMEVEMEESLTAYFVTLTYDPRTVPYTKYGNMTLTPHKDVTHKAKKGKNKGKSVVSDHLKEFMKRLRRHEERSGVTVEKWRTGLSAEDKIKYYACGEYGEQRGRPHMHLIIYNASEINIVKSWTLGDVHVVKANARTIGYVMKYLDKRLGKEKVWKVTPEFNRMSEGIGASYIAKNKRWHKENLEIVYVTNKNGVKIPMPRYYRNRLFSDSEKLSQQVLIIHALEELEAKAIKELGAGEYYQREASKNMYSEKKLKKVMKRLKD